MYLLDLPIEITRSIVQHSYEPWSIRLQKLVIDKDSSWRFQASGVPDWSLQLTCRALNDMAQEAEKKSFDGRMFIKEETSAMSLIYEAFVETAQTNAKLEWVRHNITTLRFSNPTHNPATWQFVQSLYAPELPRLQRIELDCRYYYHFAVHNVKNIGKFMSCEDRKLLKLIDFRQSFFLGCEKFLVRCVQRGLTVRVIRDMGVREGENRCKAMLVGIDYVADDAGRLVLDRNSLVIRTTVLSAQQHQYQKFP